MATGKKMRPTRSSKPKARAPKRAPSKARSRAKGRTPAVRVSRKSAAPLPEERRRAPETLRLRATTAGLTVDDIKGSMAFYTDVLGFIVSEYWTDEAGNLRGATLKAGACELFLSQDDWKKGRERPKGEGVRIWCETAQDIDALAERIKAAGATLTEEPKDESWGGRSLSLDDPTGYHLTIARYA